MARDFDYNDFDAPELVQPTPVQEEPVGRDSNRDDQVRVRRRQSSRSRSLDDQFETFDPQRPVYSSDSAPVNPNPQRSNPQRSNPTANGRSNNGAGNFGNFDDLGAPIDYPVNNGRNSYNNGDTYNNGGGYYNNGNGPFNPYTNGDAPANNPTTANTSNNRGVNNGGANPSGNNTRNNTPRQQTRRSNPQRRAQQRPAQQGPERVRRSWPKLSLIEFFKDTRTHKFLGVLLLVAAALITIFTFSHLKNAASDQAATATHTIAQIAQQPDLVENAGGPVGAKTGHFLITRTLGMGSLVVIVYLVFLGLGLLGMRKVKFWSLTFKCLLIAITTSVVLGFLLGNAPTAIYWGGTHGLGVNLWLHDHMGWIGQAAVSFLLVAAVVIVYSEELARFINRQKEVYQARRQRLAFEQDQELRRQEAVDQSLSSIGQDDYEDEYTDSLDTSDQQYSAGQSGSQYGPSSQGTYSPSSNPQGTYQPQDYQPQGNPSQGQNPSSSSTSAPTQTSAPGTTPGSTIGEGYNLNTDIEGFGPNTAGTNTEGLTPVAPADPSAVANPQNGAGQQSRIGAPAQDVPFAIDEQDIETVPVSINVVGNESQPQTQNQDVPMEVSVNDIETVDVDDVQPDYDPTAELSRYHKPSLDLLIEHSSSTISVDAEEMEANKQMIITTLRNYGIEISSIEATVGPTVTLFEVVPADGVRISAIKRLEDDIARSLSAIGIRIITPMPGKNTVGLEVPNRVPQIVSMRSILTSRAYQETKARLPMAMGTTITNEVFIEDLTKMPHLLVAGATGQGKSVGLNAIITSLLYKKHPSELKFVMVDPKMVEFSLYSKIEKHFLAKLPEEEDPIITDCDKVKQTLNSLCVEMDDRYALLKDAFVRSLEEYNAKFVKHRLNPEKGHRYLPYIVVVVDEFADLIMMAGKDIEQPIARIAQKARAVGIHLIIATQRPSTNVITGIIKANFPGRIAFKVSQMVDSRTILDRTGANQLIGKGDMLVMRDGKLERVQCAYVSTEEVEAICDDISSQVGYDHAYYLPEPSEGPGGMNGGSDMGGPAFGDRDSMFEECARFIVMQDTASTSMLQRRFSIGYNKAGRIMDQLEAAGIVSAANGQKPRMVLVDPDQLESMLANL